MIPSFAFVGQPNDGKSTLLSTLCSNPDIQITANAGTTLTTEACHLELNSHIIFTFYDTPGIQLPEEVLQWFLLQHDVKSALPGVLAKRFIDEHHYDKEFAHECELFAPLAKGCGIIFVVDGNRPIGQDDRITIEIFRLSGNSRIALINPKRAGQYVQDWVNLLQRDFNHCRILNGIEADYADILTFFEAIKTVVPAWQTDMEAGIEAFKQARQQQLRTQANLILEMLEDAVNIHAELSLKEGDDPSYIQAKLKQKVENMARALEPRFQLATKRLFKHEKLDIVMPDNLRLDIFSETVWKCLGCTKKELLWTATVIGASSGVAIDALLLGHSLGTFSLLGGALGFVGAWIVADQAVNISMPRMQIGPFTLPKFAVSETKPSARLEEKSNFFWILLDRALMFSQIISHRAHGNRDFKLAQPVGEKLGCTDGWSKDDRAAIAVIIGQLRCKAGRQDSAKLEEAKKKALLLFVAELEKR